MKKIVNNIIPLKGFVTLTIWPFIFVRKDKEHKFDAVAENHENIHGCQQKEMLIIPFFLWYLIEWVLRAIFCTGNAYRNISFEREAYSNEKDMNYIGRRKWWSWIEYMKKKQ